jgi:type VI secretion system secreted protein Hcp
MHAEDSVRAFLKIEGIQGESTNAKHAGEMDVAAFKLGVLQSVVSGAGGGGGAGKATFAPIIIYKGIDKASPLLFLSCATGQHRPEAVLTLTDHGKETFKVRLIDVLITACDMNSNNLENSELPLETVSLTYTKIEITYIPITSKGIPGTPIMVGFDVVGNVSL